MKTLSQTPSGSGEVASFVAAQGGTVYWSQTVPCGDGGATNGIWHVQSDGTGAALDLVGFSDPVGLAVDATYVYVTTGDGSVYRFDR
jgi:hypothetical protein